MSMTITTSPPVGNSLKFETIKLFKLYEESSSISIRNRIMELNIGLVRKEAHHWSAQCSESFEDLMQVGCIGMLRAVERFDATKGNAFSSFAIPYVRGSIQHFLRDKGHCVRIPRRWLELNQRGKVIQQKFLLTHGQPATDIEVADRLEVSLEDWQEAKLAIKNREPLSLDLKVNQDDDCQMNFGDCLPDDEYRSFQLSQEDQIRLQQALEQLEGRTRQILEFVFLHDLTHREAAAEMGVSVITVSRRIKQGLKSLKHIFSQEIF